MATPTCHRLALACLIPLTLLAVGCADQAPPLEPDATHALAAAGGAHVVYVAPPTGNRDLDRASILAALDEVRPGGTVQFAPGIYLIGINVPDSFDFIRVTVPRITLLGHPAGTTLRGCDVAPEEMALAGCNGLELTGGHQTVRNLTFEHSWFPLYLGREFAMDGEGNWFDDPIESGPGGYRIEGNTFRHSVQGVVLYGQLQGPSIIRDNTFINQFHAAVIRGGTAHVVDNDIRVPDPEQVPFFGYPGAAVGIVPNYHAPASRCDRNLVARNRIENHPVGVAVVTPAPDWTPTVTASCSHNVVRDNLIVGSRIFDPDDDSAPLTLLNLLGSEGSMENNLFEGNQVLGAEGIGAILYEARHNRFVNNSIRGITPRERFPWYYVHPPDEGNGSGVWISPGSTHNQIAANTFADLAASAAVLEGNHNHVVTRSASDVVRDLGIGNRVTGPGSVVATAAPAGASTGAAPTAAERAGAARRLGEHFGVRGLLLNRDAAREAAPR
jgi:hypothetical protein